MKAITSETPNKGSMLLACVRACVHDAVASCSLKLAPRGIRRGKGSSVVKRELVVPAMRGHVVPAHFGQRR